MPPPKTPLRLPKGFIPLPIQIISPSERNNDHEAPYTTPRAQPRFAFTLNLLPQTRIKEIAYHAAEYVKRKLNAFVDETRLEARDRDGHVFTGQETLADELMKGETVYLLENGRDGEAKREKSRGEKQGSKPMSRGRAASRTPSTTSRPSSVRKSRAKSEPRKTPSERALEIAQGRVVPKTEPKGSLLSSSTPRRRTPLPLDIFAAQTENQHLPSTEHSQQPATSTRAHQHARSSSEHVARQPGPIVDLTDGKAVATTANASQRNLRPPSSSPTLPVQDVEQNTSNSQVAPRRPQPSKQVQPGPVKTSFGSNRSKASPQPKAQQIARSPPPLKSLKSNLNRKFLDGSQQPPKKLQSKPDPYDLNAALADEAKPTPRSRDIMSASVRKLGGPRNRPAIGELSKIGRSQPGVDHTSLPTRKCIAPVDQKVIASTPKGQAQLPKHACAAPSSASNQLPSSPTDHIAAALAKGYAKAHRQPHPEYIVIPETDDETDERVLRGACDRFSSPPAGQTSSDGSLPWARPPLRVSKEEDPFWSLRTVGRQRGTLDDDKASRRQTELIKKDTEAGTQQLLALGNGKVSRRAKGDATEVQVLSDEDEQPVALSLQPRPPSKATPSKATPTARVAKSPVVVIHDSSSEEPVDDEVDHNIEVIHDSSSEELTNEIAPSDWGFLFSKRDQAPVSDQLSSRTKRAEVATVDGPKSHDKNGDVSGRTDSTAELLLDDELPMDPLHATSGDDGCELAAGDELQNDDLGAHAGSAKLPIEPPFPVDDLLRTDPLMETDDFDTPPSAQVSKRKREPPSDDEKSGNETARKRARKEEKAERIREEQQLEMRRAKKAQKRAKKAEDKAERKARLYEEHKRLALEQAHRRAKALEIIVSSPLRAAEMGLELSDGDESGQESGLDQNTSSLEAVGVPSSFEGSDNTDSLSSKESEGRPSWRKLSRRQFSASEQGESDTSPGSGERRTTATVTPALPSAGPAQQDRPVGQTGAPLSQRRHFDDWAFLHERLGQGTYSSWQVHNSIHLKMVHAGLQNLAALAPNAIRDNASMVASKESPTVKGSIQTTLPKNGVKRDPTSPTSSLVSPPHRASGGNEDGDHGLKPMRSIESSAQSGKGLTAQLPTTKKPRNSGRKSRARKRSWRKKHNPKAHKKLREVFEKKGGKQKD